MTLRVLSLTKVEQIYTCVHNWASVLNMRIIYIHWFWCGIKSSGTLCILYPFWSPNHHLGSTLQTIKWHIEWGALALLHQCTGICIGLGHLSFCPIIIHQSANGWGIALPCLMANNLIPVGRNGICVYENLPWAYLKDRKADRLTHFLSASTIYHLFSNVWPSCVLTSGLEDIPVAHFLPPRSCRVLGR